MWYQIGHYEQPGGVNSMEGKCLLGEKNQLEDMGRVRTRSKHIFQNGCMLISYVSMQINRNLCYSTHQIKK